jgi:hypothetical protein
MPTLEEQFHKEVKRRRGQTVRVLQKALSREFKEDPALIIFATIVTVSSITLLIGLMFFRR